MDKESQYFVQSFVRFLNQQISANGFPPDTVESLEVAAQCLETAYNLPVDGSDDSSSGAADASSSSAAATAPPPDPRQFIDLRQLFRTACEGHPDRKQEADDIKNEGNRLMREEKFEEALVCYNRAISLDPTNPVFYCNRAATYSRLGDFQRAADDCHMSLRYEPRYSKAYGRLGIALSKLGQSERAVEAYRRALELEPNNVDYLNNLQVAQQLLSDQRQSAGTAAGTAATPTNDAAAAAAAAAAGGFQLPPNFTMPSMDTLQSVMQQPAVRDFVQQMMSDPGQVDMIRNAFTGATGGAANSGSAGGAADPMAGLAGLLGGGGLANIGNLLNQLNGGGGAPGGGGNNAPGANHDQSRP